MLSHSMRQNMMISILLLCQMSMLPLFASSGIVGDKRGEGDVMHFKIGLLAPWNGTFQDFSALTSASAISLAIERIVADPAFGDKLRFSVITADSACNSKTSLGNAVKMMLREKVDAFIGPPCSISCRPVAELASSYNLPIISWVATDPDFNDKSIYTTLGRTLGPLDKMARFAMEIFLQYNWRRLAIISSNWFLWLDAGKAFRKVFKEAGLIIAYESTFERYPPDSYIKYVLTKVKEEARIVVLCVPKEDRRRFLLIASQLGMTKGDYVFYTMEMLPEENVLNPEDVWAAHDGRNDEAKEAFEAVFHVTLAAMANAEVYEFRKEVARRMLMPPWNSYIPKNVQMLNFAYGDKYAVFLYDAMLLYAIALNETMRKGLNPRDGYTVASNMRSKVFRGMSGMIVLDANGDREPDFWINDMMPNGTFVRIAEVVNMDSGARQEFRKNLLPPRWPGGKVGHRYAPPDTPPCGFRNELCPDSGLADWVIALIVLMVCAAVGVAVGIFIYVYRSQKFERHLLLQSWRIRWEELEHLQGKTQQEVVEKIESLSSVSQSSGSKVGVTSGTGIVDKAHSTILSNGTSISDPTRSFTHSRSLFSIGTGNQLFADVAIYRSSVVALKHIHKEHLQITRNILIEFNQLKTIVHENLNVFVGACIDPPNICLIWTYCPKGSLPDVLQNDDIKLDTSFKMSFLTDICKGMDFLHKSHLVSHGNLKSSNCVIDARWAVRVTDYGLPSFLFGQTVNEEENIQYRRKLWTAPELLRMNFPPPRGTQKADVFSFAIISYEIMMRTEPYCFDHMTPRDVVNRVRNGESIPFRPILPESTELGKGMIDLVVDCWQEIPDQRPSFSSIKNKLRKIAGGRVNILDTVIKMMEKYSANLEEIVAERTSQLVEEKKKTDRLLYRMLPSMVAEHLKVGKVLEPENFDQATIYFSDIVGFTVLASDSSPLQIVDFLNDLYSCFDEVISKHDVYKVETIGDAYMVVSGVPVRNGNRHAAEIANAALCLLSAVISFKIRHRPRQQLQLRIGIHSGSVVAGIVGNIMPRYCLFGDSVNMANRMESTGLPRRIHISKQTYTALTEFNCYEMTKRGEMNLKGKGFQTTYWLHGKKGYDKPLPDFDVNEPLTGNKEEKKEEKA